MNMRRETGTGVGASGPHKWWRIMTLCVATLVLAACKTEMPYSNSFETNPEPVVGETVGGADDWKTSGDWEIVRSTSDWPSRTGLRHLDSNPEWTYHNNKEEHRRDERNEQRSEDNGKSKRQEGSSGKNGKSDKGGNNSNKNGKSDKGGKSDKSNGRGEDKRNTNRERQPETRMPTGHAMLDRTIYIAKDAENPVLTYWHRFVLALQDDELMVQVREREHDRWITVASYSQEQSTSDYVEEKISLVEYKGKAIELRFTQKFKKKSGELRRWLIDDLRIADEPLPPPPVEALVGVLDDVNVVLNWQAPQDATSVAGYNVYRALMDGESEKLTASPVTETTFTDTTVTNGMGYRYTVTAVNSAGRESEPVTVQVFVAYNHEAVAGLTVTRQGWDGRIDWTAASAFRYNLYRAHQADGTPVLLSESVAPGYTDVKPGWQNSLFYWAASVADFTNPFTGETITLIGPLTGPIELVAMPPLTISLEGARGDGVGGFEMTQSAETRITLAGSYGVAVGAVNVVAVRGGDTIRGAADAGVFRLTLPATGSGAWTITVSEQDEPARFSSVTLKILPDTTPPHVELSGAAQRSTTDTLVTVEGKASDAESGLASISISTDREGGSFQPFTGADGYFYADIPLQQGVNVITATATDRAGNSSNASIQVTRQIAATPSIVITSPASGSVVDIDRISISGVVYTSQPATDIRISLGDRLVFPKVAATAGVYPFAFDAVPLNEGVNQIVVMVETPLGADQTSVTLTRKTTGEVQPTPLTLEITSPTLTDFTNADQVYVAGKAYSDRGIASISINGSVVATSGGESSLGFGQLVDLSSIAGDSITIVVVATDMDGQSATRTLTIHRDVTAPVITLSSPGLSVAPMVSMVMDNPFRLSGVVNDANLAGVNVNGDSAGIMPGADIGHYQFDVLLGLTAGEQVPIAIEAWDYAGNRSTLNLVLQFDASVMIDILAPRVGAELEVTGSQADVEVIARLDGLAADQNVTVTADDGQPVTMTVADGVARGTVTLDAQVEKHRATVRVSAADGTAVSSSSRDFSVINLDNIELAVTRSSPDNSSDGIEPNVPTTVYFNKPIDPTMLSVEVRETVHGETYDLEANRGQQAIGDGGEAKLVAVHRDRELVTGRLAVTPDNRAVVFYPGREFAYGAQVYVDIIYDGKSLFRFGYAVRSLPTLFSGAVTDELGQPLAGITVTLPSQGRSAITDRYGAYSFGFEVSAVDALKAGRQRVVINPGLQDRRYGSIEQWANIQAGHYTQLPGIMLPVLNPEVPFQRISGGQSQAIMANGDLELNLGAARLVFADGRNSGDVHVQFLERQEVPYRSQTVANPLWLFGIQPGVRVEGSVGFSMRMPPLFGSYDYLPEDGTLVLLVAFDQENLNLEPIGVGRVEAGRVVSDGPVRMTSLNYLGYVLLEEAAQDLLSRYRNGEIGLEQLIGALQSNG